VQIIKASRFPGVDDLFSVSNRPGKRRKKEVGIFDLQPRACKYWPFTFRWYHQFDGGGPYDLMKPHLSNKGMGFSIWCGLFAGEMGNRLTFGAIS
jgi:hypothetical protein